MSSEDSESSGENPQLSEAIGTRVSPGTKDRFDAYRDDHGYTNARAMRELIETGLDQAESSDGTTLTQRLGSAFVIAFVSGYPTAAAATGNTDAATTIVGAFVLGTFFAPELDRLINSVVGRATDAIGRLLP